ncbi:MAG: HEAT repeat domain-containing protein [Planctomycetes bacterium]|nr:HEAT repeat domain-containing protein [Planctomycetota bacterium]
MTRPLILTVSLFLAGCGLTDRGEPGERDFAEATGFLREEIVQRVDALQYQSGAELVTNTSRLAYIGEPAIPFLLTGLDHESSRTRSSCAFVLGNLRDRRTITTLRAKLGDPALFVRYEVATALCAMGEGSGYPVLISGLSDPEIRNRYKAHEALRLLTALDFGYRHDDEPETRRMAVLRWEEWWHRMESRQG